ncbi:MAG: hypothetical protein H0T83_09255 [Chthoniobacterales bacterium]|nr:hypothetical protein [Chthoniobacterales bacterium]
MPGRLSDTRFAERSVYSWAFRTTASRSACSIEPIKFPCASGIFTLDKVPPAPPTTVRGIAPKRGDHRHGLAPNDDRDAAILATLPPFSYTAIVRGQGDATGIGLVEFYKLD